MAHINFIMSKYLYLAGRSSVPYHYTEQQLMTRMWKARAHVYGAYNCPPPGKSMLRCTGLYTDIRRCCWRRILDNNGVIYPTSYHRHGDSRVPIRHVMKYVALNVNFHMYTGEAFDCKVSSHGDVRFFIRLNLLLNQRHNLYFADFVTCEPHKYPFSKQQHPANQSVITPTTPISTEGPVITLVVCRKGSRLDVSCSRTLILLKEENPFLWYNTRAGTYRVAAQSVARLELLYGHSIDIIKGHVENIINIHDVIGASRVSFSKYHTDMACNAKHTFESLCGRNVSDSHQTNGDAMACNQEENTCGSCQDCVQNPIDVASSDDETDISSSESESTFTQDTWSSSGTLLSYSDGKELNLADCNETVAKTFHDDSTSDDAKSDTSLKSPCDSLCGTESGTEYETVDCETSEFETTDDETSEYETSEQETSELETEYETTEYETTETETTEYETTEYETTEYETSEYEATVTEYETEYETSEYVLTDDETDNRQSIMERAIAEKVICSQHDISGLHRPTDVSMKIVNKNTGLDNARCSVDTDTTVGYMALMEETLPSPNEYIVKCHHCGSNSPTRVNTASPVEFDDTGLSEKISDRNGYRTTQEMSLQTDIVSNIIDNDTDDLTKTDATHYGEIDHMLMLQNMQQSNVDNDDDNTFVMLERVLSQPADYVNSDRTEHMSLGTTDQLVDDHNTLSADTSTTIDQGPDKKSISDWQTYTSHLQQKLAYALYQEKQYGLEGSKHNPVKEQGSHIITNTHNSGYHETNEKISGHSMVPCGSLPLIPDITLNTNKSRHNVKYHSSPHISHIDTNQPYTAVSHEELQQAFELYHEQQQRDKMQKYRRRRSLKLERDNSISGHVVYKRANSAPLYNSADSEGNEAHLKDQHQLHQTEPDEVDVKQPPQYVLTNQSAEQRQDVEQTSEAEWSSRAQQGEVNHILPHDDKVNSQQQHKSQTDIEYECTEDHIGKTIPSRCKSDEIELQTSGQLDDLVNYEDEPKQGKPVTHDMDEKLLTGQVYQAVEEPIHSDVIESSQDIDERNIEITETEQINNDLRVHDAIDYDIINIEQFASGDMQIGLGQFSKATRDPAQSTTESPEPDDYDEITLNWTFDEDENTDSEIGNAQIYPQEIAGLAHRQAQSHPQWKPDIKSYAHTHQIPGRIIPVSLEDLDSETMYNFPITEKHNFSVDENYNESEHTNYQAHADYSDVVYVNDIEDKELYITRVNTWQQHRDVPMLTQHDEMSTSTTQKHNFRVLNSYHNNSKHKSSTLEISHQTHVPSAQLRTTQMHAVPTKDLDLEPHSYCTPNKYNYSSIHDHNASSLNRSDIQHNHNVSMPNISQLYDDIPFIDEDSDDSDLDYDVDEQENQPIGKNRAMIGVAQNQTDAAVQTEPRQAYDIVNKLFLARPSKTLVNGLSVNGLFGRKQLKLIHSDGRRGRAMSVGELSSQ